MTEKYIHFLDTVYLACIWIALVAMISGAALLSVAIRTSRYRRAEEKVGA